MAAEGAEHLRDIGISPYAVGAIAFGILAILMRGHRVWADAFWAEISKSMPRARDTAGRAAP